MTFGSYFSARCAGFVRCTGAANYAQRSILKMHIQLFALIDSQTVVMALYSYLSTYGKYQP